jgi:hypothetical protein
MAQTGQRLEVYNKQSARGETRGAGRKLASDEEVEGRDRRRPTRARLARVFEPERQPWLNFLYMFAFGASRPFPSVVAKVALPNRQRAFSWRSGNYRSCPIPAIGRCHPDQTRKVDSPAGVSSCPGPAGVPTDGDDQPDPRLSDRTRHRRQGWGKRPTQVALRHIGEPQGRDIAQTGQADPGSLRGLVRPGRTH